MSGKLQDWRITTTQLYVQLYACVWEHLEPFLGTATTLELIALSSHSLHDAYPFLARLVWQAQGLEAESLRTAIAHENQAHVQAGCARLLQGVQELVQEIGGTLLARHLHTAIEQLRCTGIPALGIPGPPEGVEHMGTPASPQAVALPFMQSMAQQALRLYRRLPALQPAREQDQAEMQTWPGATPVPPSLLADTPTTSTDLERSEAFYHSLFDLSPDGVVVTNIDGMILQANPRAAEIFEFDTPDEGIGRNVADLYVHPEERSVLLEQIAKYHHVEGQRRDMRTGQGKTITIVASTRLIDFDGQPCLLSVLRDVTERARLQQELADFAYSASHDLQAPLRTFEGYARWLLEDYGDVLDSTGRQLCEEIIADALHMKKLLDGLLEYSRIGRLHTEAVAVDVKKVIDRALHDLQLEILDAGATIHVPASLPTVFYPEVRLTQVFSNLLSNALKFTTGHAPVVTIGCEDLPRYYRFTVRDNGIGIAPEHFERIFEIFKRLHTREEYPGTGAGLTIVKKIVESHGGQIGVESTPGEGSTFWFTVPKTEDRHAPTDSTVGRR
ncbi:MAG TPA: ATP-binding protein [Candidatus Tectomicrobia bacterium]|jgi:PAS domain S-box-containing protein